MEKYNNGDGTLFFGPPVRGTCERLPASHASVGETNKTDGKKDHPSQPVHYTLH